jgi:hypothetical protein
MTTKKGGTKRRPPWTEARKKYVKQHLDYADEHFEFGDGSLGWGRYLVEKGVHMSEWEDLENEAFAEHLGQDPVKKLLSEDPEAARLYTEDAG